jgi:hypothetical protein
MTTSFCFMMVSSPPAQAHLLRQDAPRTDAARCNRRSSRLARAHVVLLVGLPRHAVPARLDFLLARLPHAQKKERCDMVGRPSCEGLPSCRQRCRKPIIGLGKFKAKELASINKLAGSVPSPECPRKIYRIKYLNG